MILGTIRQRLTRNDAQLALQLLARREPSEREALEASLREQGIDALLDHPALGDAIRTQDEGCFVSLPLFTYVMVRGALRETQEHDRSIADFVSSIILHFAERDRAHRIRPHDDVVYNTLADLAADAECGDPTRAFLARAQMGHLALWMAVSSPTGSWNGTIGVAAQTSTTTTRWVSAATSWRHSTGSPPSTGCRGYSAPSVSASRASGLPSTG
jgi:hypothetical protein